MRHERQTTRGHSEVRGNWSMCTTELPMLAFDCMSSLKRCNTAERAHGESLSLFHMRAQQSLICKRKAVTVTRAVPVAYCCHASLDSLLWAYRCTTQHHKAPEHLAGVCSWLVVSFSIPQICCCYLIKFCLALSSNHVVCGGL